MRPLTMKSLVINCLAIYGAYRLAKDYLEENYGVEIVVHNRKKDIPLVEDSTKPVEKKKWAVTFSR